MSRTDSIERATLDFFLPNGKIYDLIDTYLQNIGMDIERARSFRQQMVNDWNTCHLQLEQKMWAVKHGFSQLG